MPSTQFALQFSMFLLRAGRSGKRIPVGARFSAPVQTSPWAHSAFCTVGTGSLSGLTRPGRGVKHPPPFSAEVKERVDLCLSPPPCVLMAGHSYSHYCNVFGGIDPASVRQCYIDCIELNTLDDRKSLISYTVQLGGTILTNL